MSFEIFFTSILKIIFVIVAGHIALTKIIPLVDEMLKALIKETKVVDKFTSLLGVLVFVMVGVKIIEFAAVTQNKVISYLSVIQPGLDLLLSLVPYFGYIFAATVIIIAARSFKK